jgi:hypothetical protein
MSNEDDDDERSETDTLDTEELVCPHCFYEHDYSDEMTEDDLEGIMECNGCGRLFDYHTTVTRRYRTQPHAKSPSPPAAGEVCDDPTVERVREQLLQRSKLGVSKYGQTVADKPLTREARLQHALEAHLDGAVYLQRLIDLERKATDVKHATETS